LPTLGCLLLCVSFSQAWNSWSLQQAVEDRERRSGEDDLRFDRIIRSPEEPYEGFPLDDEEKEKDRFIRILRDQRPMRNLELQFDREAREDPRFQRILRQDPDSEPRFQRILRQDPDAEPRFQRILRKDPDSQKRFRRILRQDPDLEPRFERILRQDPDLEPRFERILRQDPDLEPRFERILRQDPDSEPRFQRILRGDEHLKHFQRWRREREQRATQGAWSPVGKRSEAVDHGHRQYLPRVSRRREAEGEDDQDRPTKRAQATAGEWHPQWKRFAACCSSLKVQHGFSKWRRWMKAQRHRAVKAITSPWRGGGKIFKTAQVVPYSVRAEQIWAPWLDLELLGPTIL